MLHHQWLCLWFSDFPPLPAVTARTAYAAFLAASSLATSFRTAATLVTASGTSLVAATFVAARVAARVTAGVRRDPLLG